MIQGRRITLPVSPAGQGNNGGSDAETFENCGGRSSVRVRAGRCLARPKHAGCRNGDGYHASTDSGARRHATGDDDCHATDDDCSAGGDDRSAVGNDRDNDHNRTRGRDEEKEVREDDAAAGDR